MQVVTRLAKLEAQLDGRTTGSVTGCALAALAGPLAATALWEEARRCCALLLERGLEHRDLDPG